MNKEYATIIGPGKILLQGTVIEKHNNGKVTIDIFGKQYTGFPTTKTE